MSGYNNSQNGEDTRECEAMRKMFVGGLNRDTNEETFIEYFGRFGHMVDKVIIRDAEKRNSRGFGFITYDRSDSVESVFQARPHIIDGKTLDVKRAMPRDYNTATAHSKVTKLFIGGIGPDLAPEELQAYIESRHPTTIGTVDKIDFLKDRGDINKNKGFGFLECSDTDFADRLTISENSFTLKGRTMSLKKAEPKPMDGGNNRNSNRGSARGRGGFVPQRGGAGGRGRGSGGRPGGYNNYNSGGGYNKQPQNGFNDYSTGYPAYGGNSGPGFNNYPQNQPVSGGYASQGQGGGYGSQGQGGYGSQGQGQGGYGGQSYGNGNAGQGWNSGSRYQPY